MVIGLMDEALLDAIRLEHESRFGLHKKNHRVFVSKNDHGYLIEEEKWLTDQDTKEKGLGAWTLVYKKIIKPKDVCKYLPEKTKK